MQSAGQAAGQDLQRLPGLSVLFSWYSSPKLYLYLWGCLRKTLLARGGVCPNAILAADYENRYNILWLNVRCYT